MGLLWPKCRTLHLPLLNPIQLAPAHRSSLSRSLCRALPPLRQINTPAQLGVIFKLTEGALDPFIQIIDKDIKQDWPQHRALGNTACDRPPTGVNSIHHHSLGPAIQPVLYPAKSTPIQAMSSQFLQENAVGNAQDTTGFLGCKRTLPAHISFFIHQYPQVLLCRAALNQFITQSVLTLGFGFVELHEVHTGPTFKYDKHINCTTQLGVLHKLPEGTLKPLIYAINEDIKQYWSQYRPLRDTTRCWLPFGHRAIDCNSLDAASQFLIHLIIHPSNPYLSNLEARMLDQQQAPCKQTSGLYLSSCPSAPGQWP
ncbi:hypothetical protein QYF61_017424 [Mycteria americana]|uniref:Uncharacterized protein n=1 Tax=Mycteria americana TaxID=33587 RepID=A0AAN7N5Z0_MYCAM|nr:hypothetical protein QYF61_017424 [Mycteria americana]